MNRDFKKILMGASVVTVLPGAAMADFFKDSSANLDTKNYYFNRDYREASKQSKRDEWAQGFTFNFISGYTPGTVGFGLDVTGMLGVKLIRRRHVDSVNVRTGAHRFDAGERLGFIGFSELRQRVDAGIRGCGNLDEGQR